jgi:phage gpG-like protein
MPVTGDFGKLRELEDKLEELASPEHRVEVHRRLGEAARTLLALEFEAGTDPYGTPWAPLKAREGQPLLDTGRLRNSFAPRGAARRVSATESGFFITSNVAYAVFHQDGTAKMPKRQIVPEGDLPANWEREFAAELEASIAELFGR